MKKYIFYFFILFYPSLYAQEHSIYFDNFDGVEFETKDSYNILTITLSGEPDAQIKLAKFVFIKRGEKDYLFSTITEGEYSDPKNLDNIRSLIPPILKRLYERHPDSFDEIDRIVKLIY